MLDSHAKILVIGTGKPGLMKLHTTLVADLQEKGITAMAITSKRAADKLSALADNAN